MNTKVLYQELIKEILIDNKVRVLTFKGDSKFAKKYNFVDVLFDGKKYTLLVHTTTEGVKFGQFYFDFTLDYARLIDMIETDLFNFTHGVETQHFDFEFIDK